jgi:hypothetical protein
MAGTDRTVCATFGVILVEPISPSPSEELDGSRYEYRAGERSEPLIPKGGQGVSCVW